MIINSVSSNISVQPRKAAVPAEIKAAANNRQVPNQQPDGTGQRARSGEISSTRQMVSRSVPSPHSSVTIDLRVLHSELDALPNRKAINTYHTISALKEQESSEAQKGLDLLA